MENIASLGHPTEEDIKRWYNTLASLNTFAPAIVEFAPKNTCKKDVLINLLTGCKISLYTKGSKNSLLKLITSEFSYGFYINWKNDSEDTFHGQFLSPKDSAKFYNLMLSQEQSISIKKEESYDV